MRPILFELPIFGWPIFSYGVMLGLSCVLGAHLAVYLCERTGIKRAQAWKFTIFVIAVGLLGGRVHEIIVTGQPLSELFRLRHSGRTAYGAFLASIISSVIAAKLFRVSYWAFGDAAAPTMALGLGLTRIGCFMFGCDYGRRSDTWGMCFPEGSPAYRDQIEAGLIQLGAPESLPVFPAQLLSSLAGFSIFALLMWFWFRRPRRSGSVLLLFLFSYGLARAGLEHFARGDEGRGLMWGLPTSETIGLLTAVGAGIFLWVPPLANLRPEAGPVLDLPDPDAAAAEEGEDAKPKRKPPKKRKQKAGDDGDGDGEAPPA